jgi:hypothetical protein
MRTNNINLLVYDEEDHFRANLNFLGVKNFKTIHQIKSITDVESKFVNFKDGELIFLIVHVFYTKEIMGIREYKVSGISEKYPKLGELYVSDGDKGTIRDQMIARNILEIDKIKQYFEIKTELNREDFKVYTKSEIENKRSVVTIKKKKIKFKNGIFLSHSSKDKVIVESFKENILQLGLGISSSVIKFTSSESGGIPAGVNIPKDLKNFINKKMGLFIQFISQDYMESRTCINEEGAAWCILDDVMFIPIDLGKYGRAFIKESNKSILIDNEEALQNIYENRKKFFGNKNTVIFHGKIKDFLKSL